MTLEWYIDDLEVHAVQQCPRPQAVVVSHIGADTAELHIVDSNAGLTYRVVVASDADTMVLITSDTLVTMDSLMSGTDYVASVSAMCPDGTQTAEVACGFCTMCQPLTYADMPYELDFESYPAGAAEEPCWRFYKLSRPYTTDTI